MTVVEDILLPIKPIVSASILNYACSVLLRALWIMLGSSIVGYLKHVGRAVMNVIRNNN